MAATPKRFDGVCKLFLEGRCRFGQRCFNRHDRYFLSAGKAALLDPLINTEPDSEHHVDLHCVQCHRMVCPAASIYRINKNAVWIYADRADEDRFRKDSTPILNACKGSLSYCTYCVQCGAYIGWYYPQEEDRRLYKLVYITNTGKFNVLSLSRPASEVNAEHSPLGGLGTARPHPVAWQSEKRNVERYVGKHIMGREVVSDADLEAIRLTLQKDLRLKSAVNSRAFLDKHREVTTELESLRVEKERVQKDLDHCKQELDQIKAQISCCVCANARVDTRVNCGHLFCEACALSLRREQALCPCCREPIVSESRIYLPSYRVI
mmetsp:Transcript_13636/g.41135  ORF Transcript_13636/g.41135 Transcript_13636/m.41135 type:complete len:322 (+) Transcript_13636:173-1138(+)